ncbi:hypothetical protein N8I74_03360 [Chitiniphilus purpureus]|uniref:Uncharacterized protein n=1 Tax=Chitiniphilus purpureus TaxID=2981137 RepID=A0ABY6DNW4_9NEIS|nr:hypothetical protein [Chitiniphilus sp. CD1]UXY16075.1 hypothetical protein N8I74_03360 [Chitiniphilus sp. CD1]
MKLRQLFERLGAKDPDAWAASQVDEGSNQLHRFLFLREAWAKVILDDNNDWITQQIEAVKADPEAPFAGTGLALERLLAVGAQNRDLTDLVRGMQARLLFDLCYLLDDPSFDEAELAEVGWCLVETDSQFRPTGNTIGGLYESVLDTDPTGREMRPRHAA